MRNYNKYVIQWIFCKASSLKKFAEAAVRFKPHVPSILALASSKRAEGKAAKESNVKVYVDASVWERKE